MKKNKMQEELKVNNEVTFSEMIEQLRDSINTGVQNIEKEIKQNELILDLLSKEDYKELEDFKKNIEGNLAKLNESLDKMKEHSQLSLDLLEEIRDEKVANSVAKLLRILVRR